MSCRCPCDGCAVGRVWYTPDHAELDTYEPPDPESPYDDQDDMQEQAEDMDLEWEVYHQLLQSQDNFDSAAGEETVKDLRPCPLMTHTSIRLAEQQQQMQQ